MMSIQSARETNRSPGLSRINALERRRRNAVIIARVQRFTFTFIAPQQSAESPE